MLAVLPILALASCILACKTRLACWRDAILAGAVVWGVVLVGSTELLSTIGQLNVASLTIAWLITLACVLPVVIAGRGQLSARPDVRAIDIAILGPLGVLVLILGGLAIGTAPNTWDSMTYHLARVIHWQQAGTLAPYPTHILRQLYLQPGGEFVLFQFQLLSGGDRLAGAVQWLSMVGALVGTSLIAQRLGARRGGNLCAVAAAASVPIGVLESTSTQNDYVATFWLMCLVAFGMRLTNAEVPALEWWAVLGMGASLGLALVTKATAYLVAAPFMAWFALRLLVRWRVYGVRALALAGAIALALNASFFARNMAVFASPFGPPDEGTPALQYFNTAMTPTLLTSNLVRDLGVNLVATPFDGVNIRGLNLVKLIHQLMGADLQDPRTTWGGEAFRDRRTDLAFDEDYASNPIHLLLVVAALAAIWPLSRRLSSSALPYAAALTLGIVLFAVVLRWQPWHTRLELPFYVLAAPLIGIVCEAIAPRLALALAGALIVSMAPWVLNNTARPLLGPHSVLSSSRNDQYFAFQPDLEPAYAGGLAYIADQGCTHIGFISNQDGWEYPVWALSPGPIEIEDAAVTNVSADASAARFRPCAVFTIGAASTSPSLALDGQSFARTWIQDDIAVFVPDGSS